MKPDLDQTMRNPGLNKASSMGQPSCSGLSPAENLRLFQRVVSFYSKTLHKSLAGLDYLTARKLDDPTMLEVFQVGYSNGTLLDVLPKAGEIVDGLKALGVLKRDGQEHFQGCVTVPSFDTAGNVTGIYGWQVESASTMPQHLHVPGPLRGIWNNAAAKTSQTLFVTGSILDGMSLWQAGFKNVVAICGTNGWNGDHDQMLKDHGTLELFLCLDNDEAGRKAAQQLRERLLSGGQRVKAVHVVRWPEGVKNANDFFLSRSRADFEALLPVVKPQVPPTSEHTTKAGQEEIRVTADGFTAAYGLRRYELRAIEKSGPSRLKATIRATGDQGRLVIDTVDFYVSRSRRSFMSEAARLFKEPVETIEGDFNRLMLQLEAYVQQRQAKSTPTVVVLSDSDKAEGLKLGRQPDLTGEILRDMERLGLIGETANKLIGYLVMTSRKMADPLALLILSGSGAGKSLLQDTLLRSVPTKTWSSSRRLTERALFYMGEDALRNKVLAVERTRRGAGADYAIRNLISAKKLVKEATIKDPMTGRLETSATWLTGPCAVFQTTTQPRTWTPRPRAGSSSPALTNRRADPTPSWRRSAIATRWRDWPQRKQREAIVAPASRLPAAAANQ